MTLNLSVCFRLLFYALLFLMASCKLSLLTSIFLYLLDDLSFTEAQIIIDLALAVAALGLQESTEVITLDFLIFLLGCLPEGLEFRSNL